MKSKLDELEKAIKERHNRNEGMIKSSDSSILRNVLVCYNDALKWVLEEIKKLKEEK